MASDPLVTLSQSVWERTKLLGWRRLRREGAAASGHVLPGRREHGAACGRQLRRCREGGQSQPAVLPPRGAVAHASQGLWVLHDSTGGRAVQRDLPDQAGPEFRGLIYGDQRGSGAEAWPQPGGRRAECGRAACLASRWSCTQNDSTRSIFASRSCCAWPAPGHG